MAKKTGQEAIDEFIVSLPKERIAELLERLKSTFPDGTIPLEVAQEWIDNFIQPDIINGIIGQVKPQLIKLLTTGKGPVEKSPVELA